MDLFTEILKEHSRAQSEKIAKWIGNDAKRFSQLMDHFLKGDDKIAQRAAWILSVVTEKHPALTIPYISKMVTRAKQPGIHNAVKRNVVRVLQIIDMPGEIHGDVMNLCFDMLADVNEPVAVRCFSMTVLVRLAALYPDIKQELKSIIEDALELEASAGIKSRAKKTLTALTKL